MMPSNGTIERIERQPEIGAADYADRVSRRVLVSGFPYHVVYRLADDAIVILAIAHMKRRPGYSKHLTLRPPNAPAKLPPACAATQSATGLPRAGSLSRLLGATVPHATDFQLRAKRLPVAAQSRK